MDPSQPSRSPISRVLDGENNLLGDDRLERNISVRRTIEAAVDDIIHNPESAESHYKLGKILVKYQDIEHGIQALYDSLDRDPDFLPALKELASALLKSGEKTADIGIFMEAAKIAGRFIKICDSDGQAWAIYACSLAEIGNWEEASAALDKAFELASNSDTNVYAAQVCEAQFKSSYELEALETLKKMLPCAGSDRLAVAEIDYNIGVVSHRLGNLEQACEHLTKAVNLDEKHIFAYNRLFLVCNELKRQMPGGLVVIYDKSQDSSVPIITDLPPSISQEFADVIRGSKDLEILVNPNRPHRVFISGSMMVEGQNLICSLDVANRHPSTLKITHQPTGNCLSYEIDALGDREKSFRLIWEQLKELAYGEPHKALESLAKLVKKAPAVDIGQSLEQGYTKFHEGWQEDDRFDVASKGPISIESTPQECIKGIVHFREELPFPLPNDTLSATSELSRNEQGMFFLKVSVLDDKTGKPEYTRTFEELRSFKEAGRMVAVAMGGYQDPLNEDDDDDD